MSGYALSETVAIFFLVLLPAMLRSTTFFDRRPYVGLGVWYFCGLIGWAGVLSIFLRLALVPTGDTLGESLANFAAQLVGSHPLRGYGLKEVVGLSISFDILSLMLGSFCFALVSVWNRRHEQRVLVDLLGRRDDVDPSIRLLSHHQPIAYFLPGSGGRIVISDGTKSVLRPDELSAVIAHEHGHARGHHSSLLVPLNSLSPFVKILPYARIAPDAIAAYVEMVADDHARRSTTHGALRRALSSAGAFCAAPAGSLAWNSSFVWRRINRLESSSTPLLDCSLLVVIALVAPSLLWLLLSLR